MANKTLRILIADSRHSQTLLVERMLNRLGYYRIATASSLAEVQSLSHCPAYPFDVLIGNAWLLCNEQTDRSSQVGMHLNALIYRCQHIRTGTTLSAIEGIVVRLPGALDATALDMFVALIDPHVVHTLDTKAGIASLARCPQCWPSPSAEKCRSPVTLALAQ